MSQTLCNGDVTVVTIPQAFSDLAGSVTSGQLPSGGVPIANIAATGSPSATSFLRGDGSWQNPVSSVPAANIAVGTMASGMTLVAPVLGTPASGTLTNCTFPTLNQSTTGTAGGLTGTPAVTVAGVTCSSITNSGVSANKRVTAHAGTVPTSSSFALSAGWGTTPTLTIVGGTDQACAITIVAKATVGASPTVTYTFKDGTWTNAPIVVCDRTDVSAAAAAPGATVTNQWATTSVSATAVTFTFNGTPVANNTYGLAWVAMGT